MSASQTDAAAAAAAPIPGLVLRPYAGEADLPRMVEIQNVAWEADAVRGRISVAEVAAQVRHASDQFSAERDFTVAELDGVMVGFGQVDWIDTTDGLRELRSRGAVDPAWRRRGIGRALLLENRRHLRALAGAYPTDRPMAFGLSTAENDRGGIALAEALGYQPVRWFFDMERPTLDDVAEVPLPDGLEVRPVDAGHAHAIWEADHDAFQDHWGGHDSSEASFRRWFESPEFDPSLFVVAFDGDEIAGAVLNAIFPEENEALGIRRGWLDSVFTRRAWRRCGLARALISRSLALLRERGMTSAALGVDADNPSGALGLYEACGFAVTEPFTAWRSPFRPERAAVEDHA